ncbi:ABC transporter substrate-binding protein [Desulforhopalus sp. IMCC35007]|uniref:ABC transporter substrate-binding protein n=1 Tax=Desulforhopalus sp. IMCC35007 TaxID=2569543 RepID=UPI0010AEEB1F|nr:ABC transporter substrate-binding protein [Desulforhopalus sp. IMCC35007]TKB10412.1 hypothetical protein FCL48_07655 [Desulforhopalus sp. IMCC35007]
MMLKSSLYEKKLKTPSLPPLKKFSCIFLFFLLSTVYTTIFQAHTVFAKSIRVTILKSSNIRNSPIKGLQDGLALHERAEGNTFIYEIKDAAGDRDKLPELAAELIAEKPDVVIAAGGIEADALLFASAGSSIPVVFLLAASSVERKIVASMASSGNNFTGIDTNDTKLMAKRLWFIRKMFPKARKLFCFHVPSIVPSVQSLAVARKSADELGFELQVVEVETQDDIIKATAALSKSHIDVIFELPIAPIRKALKTIIFPKAMEEGIPVFGHDMTSIESGAIASYCGSQYNDGRQAARLVHKIVKGIAPKDIPIETPEKIELIINKNIVERLGLHFTSRVWRIADQIVDIQF